EDSDFSWDEYLEENGVTAVPHHAFKHVDLSLQTGLSPGMVLEVCDRGGAETCSVATIVTTCGQLLLLRLVTHPHRGKSPLDLLAPGVSLELQDSEAPGQVWPVVVEETVGGRLRLCYAGTEGLPSMAPRRWLFYLHPLLHPPGWAQENGCTLTPPAVIRAQRSETDWAEVLQSVTSLTPELPVTPDLFKDQPVIAPHCFSEGMKLEAVDPAAPFTISPATVTKVFSPQYFLVQMDDLRVAAGGGAVSRPSFLCHHGSPGIFPVQWSLKNGVHLTPPPGFPGQDFDWADYLKQCGAEPAPQNCFPSDQPEHDFKETMRLEAVNPLSPEHIHVATVTKVKGQHIWLQLEGVKQPVPEIIVQVDSMDIFPVSWCETNGYSLRHPSKPRVQKQRKVAVVQPEKQSVPPDALKQQENSHPESNHSLKPIPPPGPGNGKYFCPKIYFNHRCFSGPYLNKGRIAELPQCVGPGNCVLVLKEVLTLLINAAYKPSRVLRELQLDEEERWQGNGETLKAKYKGKSYRARVAIVRTAERVAEFCRSTCVALECCPNLFGPRMVLERCSENCSVLTKTRYTQYYGKKKSKRIGRPPGGHTNLEGGVKRPGKRRKRRKHFFVHKKKRSSASLDNTPAGSPQGSGDEEDLDEDDSLSEDSGSEGQEDDSEVSERKSQPPSPYSTDGTPAHRRRKTRPPSFSDDENRPPSPKAARMEAVERLRVDSSPLEWSVADVVRFIRGTDCAPLARIFLDQEIDGQALLLLTLPTVQECMDLKLGPAIKLCHHIERVKLAFYQHYAS
ncbi:SMBT1 protein, partial [Amia calva]|nr:SMBT1 protein [Amia calva]